MAYNAAYKKNTHYIFTYVLLHLSCMLNF